MIFSHRFSAIQCARASRSRSEWTVDVSAESGLAGRYANSQAPPLDIHSWTHDRPKGMHAVPRSPFGAFLLEPDSSKRTHAFDDPLLHQRSVKNVFAPLPVRVRFDCCWPVLIRIGQRRPSPSSEAFRLSPYPSLVSLLPLFRSLQPAGPSPTPHTECDRPRLAAIACEGVMAGANPSHAPF